MPSGKVKDCIPERRAQPLEESARLISNTSMRDNPLGKDREAILFPRRYRCVKFSNPSGKVSAGSWLFWMFRNSRFFKSSGKARDVSVLSKISSVVRFVNPMGKVSAIRKCLRKLRWVTCAKSSFVMDSSKDFPSAISRLRRTTASETSAAEAAGT